MNTGKTKNLGVIGWPIAHSLSPVLQNAALAAAGLDYDYIAMPVTSGQLAEAVSGLRALGFRGFNVTIPHKAAIIPLLDDIDEDARILGAVNTVVNEEGRLHGCNTDVTGFLAALAKRGVQVSGRTVSVLGCGGAARAVLWGLLKSGAAEVRIGVRHKAKALPVGEYFSAYGKVEVFSYEEEDFQAGLEYTDILVQTTPVGMYPQVEAALPLAWSRLKAAAFVYDIIYTPAQTKFLQQAKEHGHRFCNGEDMLAGQGAESFRRWTGIAPDFAVMSQALHNALGGQA